MRFLRFALAATFALFAAHAFAQSAVLQAGPITPGHLPMYVQGGGYQTVVQDSGTANGGLPNVNPKELGLTVRGNGTPPYANAGVGPLGTNLCDYDAPTTNSTGYHYLCMSPNAQGGGIVAYGHSPAAAALPFTFNVNGTAYQFPFTVGGIVGPGSSTIGDFVTWANTTGSLVADTSAITLAQMPAIAAGTVLCNSTGSSAKPTACSSLPFSIFGSESANTFFAGPTSGSAANPSFRAITGADLPAPGASSLGGIHSFTAPSHQFLTTISTAGAISSAQPAFSDLSGTTNVVTNSILAQAPTVTLKGNATGGTANEQDLTTAQVRQLPGIALQGYLYGLTLSNDSGSPNTVIDTGAGEAASTGSSPTLMALVSAITKSVSTAWAAGTGNGCLDTGTYANTTYHIFLIEDPATSSEDELCSTSINAPVLPSGYTLFRYIGSVVVQSSDILPFVQTGNDFYWNTSLGYSDISSSLSKQLVTLTVPTGLRLLVYFYASANGVSGASASTAIYDGQNSSIEAKVDVGANNNSWDGPLTQYTNTSGQVYAATSRGGANTLGWRDARGQLSP